MYRSKFVFNITFVVAAMLCVCNAHAAHTAAVTSPNQRLVAEISLSDEGVPTYLVTLDGKPVLQPSRLGVVRDDVDFSSRLQWVKDQAVEKIVDDYALITIKRRNNHYRANRKVIELRGSNNEIMQVIFQVSDDGVAFRYYFPDKSSAVHVLKSEASSFNFLDGTHAWLQPIAVAKSGWNGTNPSYEEYYEKDTAIGSPSPTGAGWIYPALFHSGDMWLLISEGSLPRNYCGTRLQSRWHSNEYTIAFPDPQENINNGAVNPQSTLPWMTPWRLIVVGTLGTIAESTLGTDLAEKPAPNAAVPLQGPGKASWSWPLLGDDKTVLEVQKQFVDYAVTMRWQYTLVDAMWDKQIGYEKLKELVDYARGKGIKIIVWYNSAGDWNTAPLTPRDRMLTHDSRIKEFEKLKAIGVAGLKVDFFGGDGQSVIAYYRDILDDAAPYGFMMNFHGATLPRGWERTYPNLMTMEAIRGLEFVTFDQKNAEEEPAHAAMLPFTRNVFDPMDFTPVVLDRINEKIERRTSSAFELALSVLFTSGVTHYAEIPAGMAKAPEYVQEFLRHVPSIWDDVKFVDGYPGKFVVMARQGNGHWYVTGINAESTNRKISLPTTFPFRGKAKLITDGEGGNLSFRQQDVMLNDKAPLEIVMKGKGGFVLVFD